MSDDSENLNRPPPDDTEETPPLGEETPRPAEETLAASLAELPPAPAAINRDGLMFAAGAVSNRWVVRLWQLTAGLLAAVGFFAGMYYRPTRIVERVEYVRTPSESRLPTPVTVPQAVPAAPTVRVEAPVPAIEPQSSPMPGDPSFTTAPIDDPAGWLRVRNDVLAAGVGAIPDHGRMPPPAPNVGLNQPAPLPRGRIIDPR